MSRGLFVVGTDTGCGKTTITVGLVAALARRGMRVAAMKPCETGDGDDARRLRSATGRALDASLMNPYRYALPAAPELAARRAGTHIDVARIVDAYEALAGDAERVLVEGAGGLLVPLADGCTMADLAKTLALPVLIVARTSLGTINHTVLTAEAIRARRLPLLGVVFSRGSPHVGDEEQESMALALRDAKLRSFGVLPWCATANDEDTLGRLVEEHLQIDRLLAAVDERSAEPAQERV